MRQMLHTKALVNRKSVGATQAGVIDEIIGSTPVIDRMGDTIVQEGWDLKDFKENPVILWGHNMEEEKMPIGKALKVWIDGKGADAKLKFKVQFDLADNFAAQVYRKIKDGFINTVSVGFIPTEYEELEPGNFWGGLKYTSQQLLELSVVPVPANPQALIGLRSFAKEDKRFAPVEETKLFKPVDKKKIAEILNLSEEKMQEIDVDPNATVGEDGSISSDTGGGGVDDHIENKPDGTPLAYNHTASVGDRSTEELGNELNMALQFAALRTQNANKDTANPTDPYNDLHGMGDQEMMPANDMQMKDMTVGNFRSLATDVFGDWMSNLNTTSNQGENSDDDMNDYAFHDGDTKTEKLAKIKSVVEKAGRVLSGKNEGLIKQAIENLQSVIAELEQEEVQDQAAAGKSAEGETKGVIGYTDHGTAPESESWDAAAEMAKATEPADWKAMCAWFDSAKPDNKTSYKLPHHQGDAGHKAVWRGVAAAMAALLGARGGVDIPEGDRKGVYNHLVKHYKEFEKEAPDFKAVEDQVLAQYSEEISVVEFSQKDKYMINLIKRTLEEAKEAKKTVKQQSIQEHKQSSTIDAKELETKVLSIFESALTKVGSINGKGGE